MDGTVSPGVASVTHRPTWIVSAILIGALVLAANAGSRNGAGKSPGPWCGGTLWRLMTISDLDRGHVRFDRLPTTLSDIAALASPQEITIHRNTRFQLNTWRLRVVVDRYRIASNGEIVLILYDIPSARYMDAYLPNPNCLGPRARDRTGMIAARDEFTKHCPAATASWQLLGATVDISGVGFWNAVRTTRGALPNGAELRPLTNLQIVSGCGVAAR
jgi:hypothetical protein